jgi:glycolate oxidase FAD binding subunit
LAVTPSFYGNNVKGEAISTAKHTGIIEYQPSELVVTVRSGTKLSDLEAELKANNQMLAFEPPQHGENTTIGGVIACAMSGPRRVAAGSARDFVLGTTIINGKAERLKFGGQVMKNVAGYDASRLMVGAQGTLGLLLDMSLKVLPLSETEATLKLSLNIQDAITCFRLWIKQGLPISASSHYKNTLHIRLSSTSSAVQASRNVISRTHENEEIDNTYWLDVKNQRHSFFNNIQNLWRLSHLTASTILNTHEDAFYEWNGALCWTHSSKNLHTLAEKNEANATRYPIHSANEQNTNHFQPLQSGLLKIHKNLKQAFDPDNILNPGRIYSDL